MIVIANKLRPFIIPFSFRHFSTTQPTIDASKDYYKILNVSRNSQPHEIKRNFYQLAKKYHPDSQSGNQNEFKLLNEAYNVLSHEQYRKRYDTLRPHVENEEDDYIPGNGPYRTKEQYTEHAKAAYYRHTQAQWAKTRRGERAQSQIHFFSEIALKNGAVSDEDILKYKYRKQMKQYNDQTNRNINMEYMEQLKQKDNQFRKKHQERIAKLKKQEFEKTRQKLQATFFGRIVLRIYMIVQKLFRK